MYFIIPKTKKALNWLKMNVNKEAFWDGESLVVEHRFVENISEALANAGFTMHEVKIIHC